MSQIDVASNSALLSVAEKLDTQNIFLAAIAAKGDDTQVTSWPAVQSVVRMGLAPKIFRIGDQLVCNHQTYGELVWDIIGFDQDTPEDTTKTHSMTLQLHSSVDFLPSNPFEALYYAQTQLPAGTYNFTLLSGYETTYGGGKTYQFTITKPLPAGGQIFFDWKYNTQAIDGLIYTYESQTSTSPIETVSVSEGNGGTALTNTNHTHRVKFGYNRWSEMALRQWLNSDKESGKWWTPSTVYSRPVDYASTKAGFLNGLDSDFLLSLGKVTKRTALNTVTDGGGYEDTSDLMFLLSRSEVYGGNEGAVDEGAPYAYYSEFSDLNAEGMGADTNRIKYDKNGTIQRWRLRSCELRIANSQRRVGLDGKIEANPVTTAHGVVPACCIC